MLKGEQKKISRRQLLRVLWRGGMALAGAPLLGCSAPLEENAEEEPLLFWDDFDGDTLDSEKWSLEYEMQRVDDLQMYQKENVSVKDGCLVLTASRSGQSITSGSVHTAGKFEFGPGVRVMVRAKLEGGYGAWPAIWAQASRFTEEHPHEVWPAGGEIDLMEAYLPEDGVETTIHAYSSQQRKPDIRVQKFPWADPGKWHLYEMEWTNDELRFSLDGFSYWSVPVDELQTEDGFRPFDDDTNAMFLHLNLAVQKQLRSGAWVQPAEVPPTMRFLVDYVRVTALKPVPEQVWVSFDRHDITVDQYSDLQLYVHTAPEAVDRTVQWSVDDPSVLSTPRLNSVFGNFYARNTGTARVTVTTPFGGMDTCVVTVV